MKQERKIGLTVQKSRIEGYGVFSMESVKKGQFIAELKGSKVHYESKVFGQSNRYDNWIGIGKDLWIDPIDEFQYLNHSCNPNAGLKGLRKLKLYALRAIEPGEEITIDYSTTEEDPDYGFENLDTSPEGYRKYIGAIDTLPEEVFHKYLPYIPTHFKKVYESKVLSRKHAR